MDEETEDQRQARADGAQLAFSTVLRELVRCQIPNEQVRANRREKLRRGIDAAHEEAEEGSYDRAALEAAARAIDSIFAPGRA